MTRWMFVAAAAGAMTFRDAPGNHNRVSHLESSRGTDETAMSDYTPQGRPGDEAVRWSHGGGPAPSASVQSTIHQMTDQLQTVIEAAERAAEAIRHDAEEQARRHLAEAQRKADRLTAERVGLISELTDDLIRHAANVRDHSEHLVRALEDAINSVTDKLEQPAMSDPLGAAVATPSPPLGDQPAREETGLPPRPATPPVHSGYTALRRPRCRHRLRLPSPREPRCPACRTHRPALRSRRPTMPQPQRRPSIRTSPAPRSLRPPERRPRTPTWARRSRRAHLRGAACPVPGALGGLRSSRRFLHRRHPKAFEMCRSPRPVRASRPSLRTPSFMPPASPPPARPARRSPTYCVRSGE